MIQTSFGTGVDLPPSLLHELPACGARRWPDRLALCAQGTRWTYAVLWQRVQAWAQTLRAAGLPAGARIGVWADKMPEGVAASFGVSLAGGVLVPINPVLKPAQVAHILADCGVWGLLTTAPRWASLQTAPAAAPAWRHLQALPLLDAPAPAAALPHSDGMTGPMAGRLESDLAVIFYTSGSTGQPKGVMVSHRNLVAGAVSVASYLGNHPDDVILAVLPLSFDAGFSQLTTAFMVGAQVVLLNHLMPMDVLTAMKQHGVTALTAVPPLYAQLARLAWPEGAADRLRYWANTGGRMPRTVLQLMREKAPGASPFLMYGLTEAFRSTYLPPAEVDRRPDSIGRAIPNADVRVLRPDGSECDVDEPGELVHRGPLVTLGYWRRPEATAERFKRVALPWAPGGDVREDRAVFSGDRVRRDAEGFLYFVGRDDEMIKTSGYRVSPTELEEAVLACGGVKEVVALGVDDEVLGQRIAVVATPLDAAADDADLSQRLMTSLRAALPAYMLPRHLLWVRGELPRNPNGKLDRQHWRAHVWI